MTLVLGALIFWVFAWILNAKLADSARAETRAIKFLVPVIFGLTIVGVWELLVRCLLYTSPSPRDGLLSRMPSSA